MKEIKILMLMAVLCSSAMMAFLSVVGPIIRALGLQEWHSGLSVSVGGILWLFFARFWGRKSDTAGRKPILIIGVGGLALTYLALGIFVDKALISLPSVLISLSTLVLLRALIGVFYSALTPVSNALIADHVQKEKRTSYIARLAASNGIGMILGPAIGGYLAKFGLSTPLYVFAFLPFLALLTLLVILPKEKPVSSEKTPMIKVLDKRLRVPMFAAFITMFVISTAQICLGFYVIDKFNLDNIKASVYTGYILASIGIVFISSQIFISKIKFKPNTLLMYGSLLGFIGYSIVILVNSIPLLTLGFAIGAFGLGMLFPAFQTLAVNSVNKKEQGAAAGTVSAAQGIGMIIAPLLSTFIYKINPGLPFFVCVLMFLALFFVSFKYLKSKQI